MKQKLPKWYQLASITIPEESFLDKKIEIVNKFTKDAEITWFLECIKFFFGKKVQDTFKDEFVKSILTLDSLFPQINNDLELKILSGAIIYNRIIVIDDYDSIKLALAFTSCSFCLEEKSIINPDIFEDINNYLVKEAIRERELSSLNFDNIDRVIKKTTQETKEINVEKTFDEVKSRFAEIKKVFKGFIENQDILAEESNIHWWLFNGFSRLLNVPMTELNVREAPFIYALELADLTQYITPPVSTKDFFHKLLAEKQKEEDNEQLLKDVVNQFIEKYPQIGKKESLGAICPLTMACNYRLELEDNEAWIKKYNSDNSINIESKVSCLDLSYQFYIENLLLNNLDIE